MKRKSNPEVLEYVRAVGAARRRWGQYGDAWHPSYEVRGGPSYCVVGIRREGQGEHQWEIKGIGSTWAEAVADADARAG